MVSQGSSEPVSAESQLEALGIVLPSAPHPLGAYVETVQSGNLLFLSGMLPVKDGKLQYAGHLGKNLDADAVRAALRIATLNALAVVKQHLGSLDRVSKVIRVGAYLATTNDFTNHAFIADAASELLRDVFGKDKMSVRSVFGISSLPLGAPVMLEVTFEVNG
jgi:enamine deaminase RidA (YjgF/YER057c/UK114 family)